MDSAGQAIELIGEHPLIRRLNEVFRQLGTLSAPVLLIGETGTGKQAAAHAIHSANARVASPFIVADCVRTPADALEADLFGVEQDAFAGGVLARSGKIHRAAGGTLYVDEITALNLSMQETLVGWLRRRNDIRLIAATSHDLRERRERGLLRQDLFDLLQSLPITLPALRERRSDVPILVRSLLSRHREASGRQMRLSETAMIHLWEYDWPGNVAELTYVLDKVFRASLDGCIEAEDLPAGILASIASKRVQPMRGSSGVVVPAPPAGRRRPEGLV
jgi:sigma-54 specific flagellar transcriptional regulator A